MDEGVSCLCLTYGRPFFLEEAIESFLRQEWSGPKELIVVNDHPSQELRYEHDEVLIVNLNRRLRTLGEKRNLSVALAKYDNLLIWDDDDIHLPWRIAETMKGLPGRGFYKCPTVWLWHERDAGVEKTLSRSDYGFHCAAAFHRSVFEAVGGYKCMNAGEDFDFEQRIIAHETAGECWETTLLPVDRVYYIYRWHKHYHASYARSLSAINPSVKEGLWQLNPKWERDYGLETFDLIAAVDHVP
ncbi:glycosyltransferase [Dyella terrae]|uniref:glycosyltransferase n=1 Tax=Dyella terrae TaxID=522259 RepID=UPI001EFE5520|nr:glycosyltransferase family A protein [Dyella terrae]ULU25284.1 Glycosyl transferase family 2 protein [Dyella terrae]